MQALLRVSFDVLLIFPKFILKQQTTWIFTGMKAELLFITETRDDSSRTKSGAYQNVIGGRKKWVEFRGDGRPYLDKRVRCTRCHERANR